AGSSYGASQTLDLPTRLAMITRRQEHADMDRRVLRWMAGNAEAASKITVTFPRLVDPAEQYREMQMATLPWLQGVVAPEVYQGISAKILGTPLGALPEGLLLPNNKDRLPRKDIDRDGAGGTGSTAAPTQGRGNGNGDQNGRPTDTRRDIQSN